MIQLQMLKVFLLYIFFYFLILYIFIFNHLIVCWIYCVEAIMASHCHVEVTMACSSQLVVMMEPPSRLICRHLSQIAPPYPFILLTQFFSLSLPFHSSSTLRCSHMLLLIAHRFSKVVAEMEGTSVVFFTLFVNPLTSRKVLVIIFFFDCLLCSCVVS